jgi:hypothetical protein
VLELGLAVVLEDGLAVGAVERIEALVANLTWFVFVCEREKLFVIFETDMYGIKHRYCEDKSNNCAVIKAYHYTVVQDGIRLQQPESNRIANIQVATLVVIEFLHIHQLIILRIVDDPVLVKIS